MDSFASTYLGVFLDELEEQLQTLDHAILELESGGNQHDTVQRIFRAAHTLKGSSAAMGFHQMKEVTHKVESVFDLLRQDQLSIEGSLINTLFDCIDFLKIQRESLKQGEMEEHSNESLLQALDRCMINHYDNASMESVTEEVEQERLDRMSDQERWSYLELEEMARKRKEEIPLYEVEVSLSSDADMPKVRGLLVHRTLSETGEVVGIYPPMSKWDKEDLLLSSPISFVVASSYSSEVICNNVLQLSQISDACVSIFDTVLETEEGVSATTNSSMANAVKPEVGIEAKVQVQQTVRVDVKRLEHLLNLVGELIIDNTRLQEVRKRLDEKYRQETEVAMLGEVTDHLNRVIAELQEGLMKTRMLPIEQLFNRFPRLVRDLSQQAGKEINFSIEGKETELDRTLIEEISDPLIHILRNAADHGLESPDERERLGKPRKGELLLQASHQESAIVIRVQDDGRGIDPNKIKQKAIQKGFISTEEASRMSDKEIISLIFHSGMSTAEQVTELSGRGVGMDIVRSHIEKLNGLVDIDTTLGKGTTLTIKLPLTLAITRSLLVEIGKLTFAIPLVHVLETFQLNSADIQSVHGKEICTVRGDIFPLVRLHDKLRTRPNSNNKGYAVMIGAAEKRVCLYVDRLVANQEIVMKALSSYLGQVHYVSGSSILGNGSIAYILDVNAVVRDAGTVINNKNNRMQDIEAVQYAKKITFALSNQLYALDIDKVKEIIRVPNLTSTATSPSQMLGLFNLRGSVLPAVDLSQCLGMEAAQINDDSRIIIMKVNDSQVGVLVDSVMEVFNMPNNEVEETSVRLANVTSEFLTGIHKRGDDLTMLLEIDKLLAFSGFCEMEEGSVH
ncbi:chemotaxis protein CheW [Cohnella abietis]|uniref:Chemotaxis protein CheA n=1 Tax=Cohnella abietis TaxID=2507935 RepID=A0A3T1DCF2_9BACL|nr:chemotaxis protein CheW [Cohnella abietis]BBI35769.1 chemotaxis protein CheA [Cohnella abietis]